MNKQKRMAIINDISGFGRCSIAVSLPIVSHLRIQGCIVPTAVLSNHTGFASYFFDDYTDRMEAYIAQWKKLSLTFDGLLTGFLGSMKQIEIVERFVNDFCTADTRIVIDPVMGDNGRRYSTYTEEMCNEMKKLIKYADILTPNLTEACILTDTPYKEAAWTKKELYHMAETLTAHGAKKVVVSGIPMGAFIGNVLCEKGQAPFIQRAKRVGQERSGTGDVFSAVIAADCVNNVPFADSVRKASAFVKACIAQTEKYDIPLKEGVCFEEILYRLQQ